MGVGGKGPTVQILANLFQRGHFTALMDPCLLALVANGGLDSPRESNTKNQRHDLFEEGCSCSHSQSTPDITAGDSVPPRATEGMSLEPGLRGADRALENKNIWREKSKPTLKGVPGALIINYSLAVSGLQNVFCSPRDQERPGGKSPHTPFPPGFASPHSCVGSDTLFPIASRTALAIISAS